MQNDETELIAQSLCGKSDAYAQLTDRYKNAIYHHCFAMLRDPDAAEDMTQETFISAYYSLKQYKQRYRFSTWLFRISTNKCLNYLKKHRREVPQDELAAMAEAAGIIEVLGDWVMRKACGQIASWHIQFPNIPNFGVTVAVAPERLIRPDFLASVRHIVEEAGLEPGQLCLEIATTPLIDNPELTAAVLHELNALAVQVSLDDGGTGFSSLTHLHRFAVASLKIDRSLVARISRSDIPHEPVVIENIVALAKTLGGVAIADGVETAEQLRELLRLGCNQAQGPFFSNPLPSIAAEAVLAAYDGRAAVSRAAVQAPVTIH